MAGPSLRRLPTILGGRFARVLVPLCLLLCVLRGLLWRRSWRMGRARDLGLGLCFVLRGLKVESIGETREVSEAAKLTEERGVLMGDTSGGPSEGLTVAYTGSSGVNVGDGWE